MAAELGHIQKIIDASKVRNHLDIHDLLEASTVTSACLLP